MLKCLIQIGAEVSGQFGTIILCRSVLVPKCPGAEMSRERNTVDSADVRAELSYWCGKLQMACVMGSQPRAAAMQHSIKGHRQRISTFGYKTIFRKINTQETFLPFTVIKNKDYFSRFLRNLLSYCRGICDLYLWRSWRHWWQLQYC